MCIRDRFYGGRTFVPARRDANGNLTPAGMLPGSAAFSSAQIEAKKRKAGMTVGKDLVSIISGMLGDDNKPEPQPEKIMTREEVEALGVAIDPISGEINYVETGLVTSGQATQDPDNPGWQSYITKPLMMLNEGMSLVQTTPQGILQIIDESFDDPGDIPKHVKELIMSKETDLKASSWMPETDLKDWNDLVGSVLSIGQRLIVNKP